MEHVDNFELDRQLNIAQVPGATSPSPSPAPEILDASLRNAIALATTAQLRNALSEICTKSSDARQLAKSLLQSSKASPSPKTEKSP
jgi:hypothetical protein